MFSVTHKPEKLFLAAEKKTIVIIEHAGHFVQFSPNCNIVRRVVQLRFYLLLLNEARMSKGASVM